MKAIKVLSNQSIFDIALQHCGNIEFAWDIAKLNGITITDWLYPGRSLMLPDNASVLYQNIVPNTGTDLTLESSKFDLTFDLTFNIKRQ